MMGLRRLVVLHTKPPVIFIRRQMLAQALPAAQNLSTHCPIYHPSLGYGAKPHPNDNTAKPVIAAHGAVG